MEVAVLLISLVQISALDSIATKFYSDDFAFPLEKSDDFSSCTFDNGTIGQCVSVSDCPHARNEYQSGINPTLCHFEKVEPVVCCILKHKTAEDLVERRKSAASCEDVYSMAVPTEEDSEEGEFYVTIVGGEFAAEEEFPHMVRWLFAEGQVKL